MDTITSIKGETGRDARRRIRAGGFRKPTAGMAPGYVQGNLAILPKELAADFTRFCMLNPKPCPLLGQSEPGDWRLPMLGEDLDIRTDIPLYRIWRKGELVEEVRNLNVPMYRTNIECKPAGPFHGPMVVSMRPFRPADAIRAVQVTTRFPSVHGAPVHLGKPELIGIKDIAKPDYGDAVPVRDDELPVFWACGVTPQSVVATVKPEFCITHAPGYMLVTDLLNSQLAIL